MMRSLGLWWTCAAVLFTACNPVITTQFNAKRFPEAKNLSLAFDLDQPRHAVAAGLLLPKAPTTQCPVFVILPFGTTASWNDPTLLSTSADYDQYSLIAFVPRLGAPASIGFSPRIPEASEQDFYRSDLPGNFYILAKDLKRRFLYRPINDPTQFNSSFNSVQSTTPDSIVVRLPAEADVIETTAMLRPASFVNFNGGLIRTYTSEVVNSSAAKQVEILYQVPASENQKLIAEQLVKFFAVILVPVVEAIFLSSARGRKKTARRLVIGIGTGLELLLLAFLLWWSFHIKGGVGIQAWLDVGNAVVGAAATGVIAFIRSEETSSALPA